MGRVLLAAVLVASVAAVPAPAVSWSAAPAVSPGDVVHRTYEALARDSDTARDVLRRYQAAKADAATAAAPATDIYFLFDGGDLDGDRVHDVVRYRTVFTAQGGRFDGYSEVFVYSGRTGAFRWQRRIADFALGLPTAARVGRRGAPGLLLVATTLGGANGEHRVRAVGLDGARGGVGYDRTVSTSDGLGDIAYGGTFDAYPGGGTDLLFGRVKTLASAMPTMPQLLSAQPFALNGSDGALTAIRASATVAAAGVAYVAVGDVDGDKRDEFVEVRRLSAGRGDVTLHGVAEGKTYWTARDLPTGISVGHGGTANMAGGAHRDVVLDVRASSNRGPLAIDGVTDGVPLVSSPEPGVHGLLLDGDTGELRWDHLDGDLGGHVVWGDVDKDGKPDVLATSLIRGERDGIRISAVNGAGKVLYRRDVTVKPPPNRHLTGIASYPAGDLDGDGVGDIGFNVVSQSSEQQLLVTGLFLVRKNDVMVTPQYPLSGAVDGGTAERVHWRSTSSATTLTVLDGWRGRPYWTVRAGGRGTSWSLSALNRAGGCADVLLQGVAGSATWVDALDGRTGRRKWSRTLSGKRPATTVTVSGRAARCR